MEQQIEQFLAYLQGIKQASPHTIRNYRIDLSAFSSFLEVPLEQAGKTHIRSFIAAISTGGASRRTVLRKISSLRSFFKFLVKNQSLSTDPMQLIDSPKAPQNLPKALDYQQIESLFATANTEDFLGLRDRAMMELFYSSGLRVSELVGLNRGDIQGLWMRVRGKGKRERVIPMTAQAAEWIKKYLGHPGRSKEVDLEAIFLNRWGKRLSPRSVDRLFQHYWVKSGLAGRVTPHTIRHTIATHWLEKGMDLKLIQSLLGHSTLKATTIYTKVSAALKQDVYAKAHPRAKKRPLSLLDKASSDPF